MPERGNNRSDNESRTEMMNESGEPPVVLVYKQGNSDRDSEQDLCPSALYEFFHPRSFRLAAKLTTETKVWESNQTDTAFPDFSLTTVLAGEVKAVQQPPCFGPAYVEVLHNHSLVAESI